MWEDVLGMRAQPIQLDAVQGTSEERSKVYFDGTSSSTGARNAEMRELDGLPYSAKGLSSE